jgi:2-desacetyl-2-hydroxyethyl bacteriochlorophyllide A dehydrogenase
MTTFKKIQVIEPGVVTCADDTIDEKIIPHNHVLVRNHYSLISTGTELACVRGIEQWFSIPGTPGYCSVGEVIGIGDDTEGFAIGDLVYTDTGHFGMFYYPVNHDPNRFIMKIPSGIPHEIIPYIRMASIALTSVNTSCIQLGDKVLVAGLGVVGNFAAQFARLSGAEVLCTEPCIHRAEAARACGLTNIVSPDPGNMGHSELKEITRVFTDGNGFDTVIDATGSTAVIESLIGLIAHNGELILLGTPRNKHCTDLTVFLRAQHLAETGLTVKGAHEVRYPTWKNPFTKHSRERNAERILTLLLNNCLQVRPLITKIVRPEDALTAYDTLMYHADETESIVFDFSTQEHLL